MVYDFNIDIHCHTSWKPYLSGRNKPLHTPFESYRNEIKHWLYNLLNKQIENLVRVKLGTQSNFDNLYKGKVRVAVVSLAPIEKAFFLANLKAGNFLNEILRGLVYEKETGWDVTIKTEVVNAITGFYMDDLEFTKRNMQQYFEEALVPEYSYFTKFNNQKNKDESYAVRFVKNYKEIEDIILADRATICIIISIEGAHALSSHAPDMTFLRNVHGRSHQEDPPDLSSLAEYTVNIAAMKKWEFVPLYITLTHHFWNGLAGHAKSLISLIGIICSQDEGINEGLKELGKEVIRLLLDTANGPRILLDIKHMSPQCRKDFYSFIKTEYWNKNDQFPLLCSHTGVVSKSRTLDDLIVQDDEKELLDNSNYLHENSINLCAEDILIIAETNGLIGIQLDEKRLAGDGIITMIKNNKKLNDTARRRQYVKLLFANLFEIVRTVNTKQGWDLLSIGSDYDGMIQHIDLYPTTAEMPDLRNDMLAFLKAPEEISQAGFNYTVPLAEIKRLMFGLTAEEIINKIFAGNVMRFLQKNFNN